MTGSIILKKSEGFIEIIDNSKIIKRQHILALHAFGFEKKTSADHYTIKATPDRLMSVHNFLKNYQYDVDFDPTVLNDLEEISNAENNFKDSKQKGEQIKKIKSVSQLSPPNFVSNIKIKPYQLRSIHHMIEVLHAANFSVPGSGKTLMTYATFDILRERGDVESLLVIGPIASFGPWEHEYRFCMNKHPTDHILRYHGSTRKRLLGKLVKYDIIITSYDTASNDWDYLKRHLLERKKVMLVIDESHHIKSIDENAKHASKIIDLGKYAKRRYILSGTPMPHSLADLWSQMTFLWPQTKILFSRDAYKKMLDNYGIHDKISEKINFVWTRVTNNHLEHDMPSILPEQEIIVKMSSAQEAIYKAVERDIWKAHNGSMQSIDLFKFRKNRILRLLQCVSNPHTMLYRDNIYDLDKFSSNDLNMNSNMDGYNEIPPKISEAAKCALKITAKNQNVVVWTVFVKNVEMLCEEIKRLDPNSNPIGISGDVPTSPNMQNDILNREQLIDRFKKSTNGILVATIGSIAESISLHKTCHNAIYLERSFNAGQYMQSLSRIYRIGSDKKQPIQFTFLKSVFSDGVTGTIDNKIEIVLKDRIKYMYNLLNDEFTLHPLELDTSSQYSDDEESAIYDSVTDMIEKHKSQGRI